MFVYFCIENSFLWWYLDGNYCNIFLRGLLFMQANKRETLELFWAGKRFSPFIKGVPCCTIHTAEQKYKSQCLVSNNGYADMLIKLLLIYY